MFYLTTFYKALLKTPLKSLLFLVLGLTAVVGISNKGILEQAWMGGKAPSSGGSYFYSLISSKKNYLSISQKIRDLPGVDKVNILPEKMVKKSASEIFEQSDLDIALLLEDFKYVALKVVFSETLGKRSRELVREYLGRLAGKNNIALGAIKKVENMSKQEGRVREFLRPWGVPILLLAVSMVWVFLAYSYVQEIGKRAYLIENFQRRKGVASKTACAGVSSIFMGGALLSIIATSPELKWLMFSLIPFLAALCFFIKGGKQWQS